MTSPELPGQVNQSKVTEFDTPSAEELASIEEKYDEGARIRSVTERSALGLRFIAIVFAVYHYLTAGFGLPPDHWHMGWHLCGLFILTYAFYPVFKTKGAFNLKTSGLRLGGIPLLDIVLMVLGVCSALYLGLAWHGIPVLGIEEQTYRMGNPNTSDMVFGIILIVLVLDIARRTLGWVLPLIILVFISYALFGPHFPGLLQHPGVKFRTFVSSMYFPQEGIFGVTLWVVSTIVFHFVLFGVIAQRTGLGQLFIDNASILAGRYVGGPAKVSVVSSAFFGTISGSSVANTVSTGALTIPNMKRLGYPGHFAGGVEAASSAGGQITPPIMGAAAFIMAEFLEMPYTTIVIAAIFPALLHYVGVFAVVHLMARKLDLRGLVGFVLRVHTLYVCVLWHFTRSGFGHVPYATASHFDLCGFIYRICVVEIFWRWFRTRYHNFTSCRNRACHTQSSTTNQRACNA